MFLKSVILCVILLCCISPDVTGFGLNRVQPYRSSSFSVSRLEVNMISDESTSGDNYPVLVSTVGAHHERSQLLQSARLLGSVAMILTSITQQSRVAVAEDASDRNYVDKKNGFSITIPVGFSSMPRKKVVSDGTTTGVPVEILLVAQDFLKGASLSVGRSDVQKLLEDFSVPWAGKPVKTIADVGTANIVSELLILQRQGAFGSIFFKTKLGVTSANEAQLTNMDNNISEIITASLDVENDSVNFEFKTPLSAGIRYTIATSRLKGNFLYTVWLSVLGPVYETDYKGLLLAARNSFELIPIA